MESWTITITSPLGETKADLRFEQAGTALTGDMSGKGGSGPMEDGKADGDRLSWTCRIEKPAPMKLKFKGARDGDTISGTVKFGLFASGRFDGRRSQG